MKLQDMEYIINFLGIELQMNLHQDAYPRLYELEQSSSERKPLPFLKYCIEKKLDYHTDLLGLIYFIRFIK